MSDNRDRARSARPTIFVRPGVRQRARQTLRAAVSMAAAVIISPLATAALPDYGFAQITEQPFGSAMFEPSISADGSRVAFRSSADLDGPNVGDNFEIFVHDRVSGTTVQLTETPGGVGNFAPLITPDGARVIFRSVYDFAGGSAGGTFQLWEVEVATGEFRLVTNVPPGKPVFDPRLSGDGNFAVFVSRFNPTGQNGDGSEEIFRIDVLRGAVVQVSNNAALSAFYPDVNGDGSRIVWADRANYDGSNPNGGMEIWLWDQSLGISHVTAQNTSTVEATLPRIDHQGRYVVFLSLFDYSGAGVVGRKVFLADTQRGSIELLTNPGVGGAGLNFPDAAIAPDGSAVYFESDKDLVGLNPDLNRELYVYDNQIGLLSQATSTTAGYSIPQLSDEAKRHYIAVAANNAVAYRSEQDLDPSVFNNFANLDLFLTDGALSTCLGDLDLDGLVGGSDLGLLLAGWFAGGSADIDGSGLVDGGDVGILLAMWGACG